MQLTCPQCRQNIHADDININTTIAKCRQCHAVFGFADKVGNTQASYKKPAVDMPKGFDLQMTGDGIVLIRRWFSWIVFPLFFFCIFWDGFLVFWYREAIRGDSVKWVMALFPLLHVAIGLGLTYFVIATFFNKTYIRMDYANLSVRHGPIPWPGNRTIPRHDISQLLCKQKISHSRNGTSVNYSVCLIPTQGNEIKLIGGLTSPEQALFIEQQVENHLGIRDRAVQGEHKHI